MLEFQLTSNSTGTMHLWLTALLSLSFLLTVVFLLHFASGRFALSPKYERLSKLLLAVMASLQILAWQLYLYSDSHDKVALWCFPVAIVAGAIVWRCTSESMLSYPFLTRVLPIATFFLSLIELAGFAQATKQFSESTIYDFSRAVAGNIGSPGRLVDKATVCGTTDRGQPIRLLEREITPIAFEEYIKKCRATMDVLAERAMLRAQPYAQSNCHGWVFTQGQHILKGEDVQCILTDNNYIEVSTPQANDIAVYRSDDGMILHTGLVRGSLEGATIVESKWGIGALYLHVAEEQPYSPNITYYRTDRPSHDITIVRKHQEATTSDSLLADQLIDDSVERAFLDPHFCSSQSE
ncbi:MAG: hypothetical protein SFV81_11670 [Pirellulaceae bacterium]|nr:hypothetical protein [Pirellulaceae bacterium]